MYVDGEDRENHKKRNFGIFFARSNFIYLLQSMFKENLSDTCVKFRVLARTFTSVYFFLTSSQYLSLAVFMHISSQDS